MLLWNFPDPIPKPPQYPCARPPRSYIPGRPIPNASPGVTRSMRSSFSSDNIAVVSPLPSAPREVYTVRDDEDFIHMVIKQVTIISSIASHKYFLGHLSLPSIIVFNSFYFIHIAFGVKLGWQWRHPADILRPLLCSIVRIFFLIRSIWIALTLPVWCHSSQGCACMRGTTALSSHKLRA